MTPFKFSISQWLGTGIELLTPLLLIAAIFTFSVALWPVGIIHVPLAQISLYDGIAVASSVLTSALGLTGLYLVAIEQISRSHVKLRDGAPD